MLATFKQVEAELTKRTLKEGSCTTLTFKRGDLYDIPSRRTITRLLSDKFSVPDKADRLRQVSYRPAL